MAAAVDHDNLIAEGLDGAALRELAMMLADPSGVVELSGPGRSPVRLPGLLREAICEIVAELMVGGAVSVQPMKRELTTQQAADLLNVSRPYLVGLLEQGVIPFYRVGNRRRLRLCDVLAYRERVRAAQHAALDEMAAIAQAAGIYD